MITVLLVDDVPALRMLVNLVLSGEPGIEVVGEAANGKEAIEIAREHQPAIVMLDLNMPVMNGMEALPQILEVSPDSQVIVMSGFDRGEVEQSVRDLGAVRYIEKGTDVTGIVDVINEVAAAQVPAPR